MKFELINQSLDEFNSPTFESEVQLEGIPACKGKGYSKKESQQIAAHETLNRIKKDSAFLESVLAAKALREEPKELEIPIENTRQSDFRNEEPVRPSSGDWEKIICEAEEAAYSENYIS